MAKSVNLSIRLPEGIYEKIQKIVEEQKIASSCSGYCRQIIINELMKE